MWFSGRMNLSLFNNNAPINFSPGQTFDHHLCWGIGEFEHCLGGVGNLSQNSKFSFFGQSISYMYTVYVFEGKVSGNKIKACFERCVCVCVCVWGGGGCSGGMLNFWINQPITKDRNENNEAFICMHESGSPWQHYCWTNLNSLSLKITNGLKKLTLLTAFYTSWISTALSNKQPE